MAVQHLLLLAERMVEDMLRDGEEEPPEPLTPVWRITLRSNPVVRQLTLQYLLKVLRSQDHASFAQFVPLLVSLSEGQEDDGQGESLNLTKETTESEMGPFLYTAGRIAAQMPAPIPPELSEQLVDELLMEYCPVSAAARLGAAIFLESAAGRDTASPLETYLTKLVECEEAAVAQGQDVPEALQKAYGRLLTSRQDEVAALGEDDGALGPRLGRHAIAP